LRRKEKAGNGREERGKRTSFGREG